MNCIYCQKETNNPKFCSKTCSITYANINNPKRKLSNKCKSCGCLIRSKLNYCGRNCWPKKSKKITGYEHIKNHRKRTKKRAVDYKGGKCTQCGYSKCIEALEFHHIDPNTKDFTLSANLNRSFDSIKIELDKCILLCANCHRELHAGIN